MSANTEVKIKGRFSYPHLFEPSIPKGSTKAQYSLALLIPKTDTATIKAVEKAISYAEEEGASLLEKVPMKKRKKALQDGDEEKPDDPAYKGMMFINCNNTRQPGIVDKKLQPIISEEDIYPGCYGIVHINFFAYNNTGAGIGASLQNVMKTKDGDRLDSRVDAATAFAGFTDIDDEDDDDSTPPTKKVPFKEKTKPAAPPADEDDDTEDFL